MYFCGAVPCLIREMLVEEVNTGRLNLLALSTSLVVLVGVWVGFSIGAFYQQILRGQTSLEFIRGEMLHDYGKRRNWELIFGTGRLWMFLEDRSSMIIPLSLI